MGRSAVLANASFVLVLSLRRAMHSASGPMKAMPFFRQAAANSAFSERKP